MPTAEDHSLLTRLAKLARADAAMRPMLMPILREAATKRQPGEVWQTKGGWRSMNPKGKAKTFENQDQAKVHAKGKDDQPGDKGKADKGKADKDDGKWRSKDKSPPDKYEKELLLDSLASGYRFNKDAPAVGAALKAGKPLPEKETEATLKFLERKLRKVDKGAIPRRHNNWFQNELHKIITKTQAKAKAKAPAPKDQAAVGKAPKGQAAVDKFKDVPEVGALLKGKGTQKEIDTAINWLTGFKHVLRKDLLDAHTEALKHLRSMTPKGQPGGKDKAEKGKSKKDKAKDWKPKELSTLEKKFTDAFSGKDDKPKADKGKSKKDKSKSKSYKKTYAKPVMKVMDKYDLTDDDAAEVKKQKKGLFDANAKSRMTDAARLALFLSKAKPETKERMKGMSPADFMKILGAIMDEEEGGMGKAASTLIRLARLAQAKPELQPQIMPILRRAMDKQALGAIAIKNPDVMLYMIDRRTNKSKFYELRVVQEGTETRAKKTKTHGYTGGWVLERRWGRLTDSGATGRVDSINDVFDDRRAAERAMAGIKAQKTGKGYQDVTRKREYPIGLGSAGFGWGGQAACRVIPEMNTLQAEMGRALAAVGKAQGQLRPIAAQDSNMAKNLTTMLELASGNLTQITTYLDQQLAHCR